MELEAAQRRYDALHEAQPWHDGTFENWSAEKSPAFPYGHRDGVQIWVSDLNVSPDDKFLNAPAGRSDAKSG